MKNKTKGKKEGLLKSFGVFKKSATEWKKIEKIIYEDRERLKLRKYKL